MIKLELKHNHDIVFINPEGIAVIEEEKDKVILTMGSGEKLIVAVDSYKEYRDTCRLPHTVLSPGDGNGIYIEYGGKFYLK